MQVVNETIHGLKSSDKLDEMGRKWFKNYDEVKKFQNQVPAKSI